MASDIVPATREALARALRDCEIAGDAVRGTSYENGGAEHSYVVVVARYPEDLAGELMSRLGAEWDEKLQQPPVILARDEPDAEIAAIDTIRDALDGLGDPAAVSRVLRWACGRYGVSTW